jgi:ribokinase
MRFVTAGGMRLDFLITHDGKAQVGLVGGNALYAAVGAAVWAAGEVRLWARIGANYPQSWLQELQGTSITTEEVIRLENDQDHRTFFAYLPDGRRDDTNPAGHFARIGQPLPPLLKDYVHSTPGQDDPTNYEPLALRPSDWPVAWGDTDAVHFSPLALATQLHVPPFLSRLGLRQISVDPGERYMVPDRLPFIRRLLADVDIFMPSRMEIESLFGAGADIRETAVTLTGWGVSLVVIKDGANGVWLYEREEKRLTHIPAYHRLGDRRVVDVTGAGDSFCGGFMVGLASSGDPQTGVRYGIAAASLVIEGYGALYALSRHTEARRRLAQISG